MNEDMKRKTAFNWKNDIEEKKKLLKELLLKLTDKEIAVEINKRWPEDGKVSTGGITKRRQRFGLPKPSGGIQKKSSIKVILKEIPKQVLDWLQKESLSVGEISRRLDRSKETIIKILDNLREDGYEVNLEQETRQVVLEREIKKNFEPIALEPLYKKKCSIMLLADTHLCSKYQQLTLLHTAYKIAEQKKVSYAVHFGDLGDGEGVYRGHDREIFVGGVDDQTDYIIDVYPKTKVFKTYIIPGNHDWIWMKRVGFNLVRRVSEKRNDLVYTPGERKFSLRGLSFQTLHPTGGLPYASSYRIQKLVEGAIGEFIIQVRAKLMTPDEVPQFYGAGHLHVGLWMPYMGFHCFMVPCFQSQTPYLRDKGHFPQVGFFIIDVNFDDDGNVTKITHEYYDFNSQIIKNDY